MKARLPKEYQNSNANMNAMVKKAQKMQEDIAKIQEELEQKEFTKSVGGGAIELVMTGNKQLKSVTLKPEIVNPDDLEMLEDLIISGVNEILTEVDDYGAEEMEKATGGVSFPASFKNTARETSSRRADCCGPPAELSAENRFFNDYG